MSTYTIHFECTVCAVREDGHGLHLNAIRLPEGWREGGHGLYCSQPCARQDLVARAVKASEELFAEVKVPG